MIRRATTDDLPALRSFLRPHAATSLFLSSGLAGATIPKTTPYWIASQGGEIRAAFSRSQQGFLLCEAPDFDLNWAADLRRALSGQEFLGLNGEAHQIATLRSVLGLDQVATTCDKIEPLLRLALDDLTLPDGATNLHPVTDADLALVLSWRLAYDREVFGEDDTAENRYNSEQRTKDLVQTGRLRLLTHRDTPVAMTGFNAVLPHIVQIGSVYTPPAYRGQGHARRALALHLAQARDQGVTTAVLFASGPAAVRAYQSIGFTRIGDYAVIDFTNPARIGDPA